MKSIEAILGESRGIRESEGLRERMVMRWSRLFDLTFFLAHSKLFSSMSISC